MESSHRRTRPVRASSLELRMQRRKFHDIVPDSFQGGLDDLIRKRFMTDEVNVIGEDTGIAATIPVEVPLLRTVT